MAQELGEEPFALHCNILLGNTGMPSDAQIRRNEGLTNRVATGPEPPNPANQNGLDPASQNKRVGRTLGVVLCSGSKN